LGTKESNEEMPRNGEEKINNKMPRSLNHSKGLSRRQKGQRQQKELYKRKQKKSKGLHALGEKAGERNHRNFVRGSSKQKSLGTGNNCSCRWVRYNTMGL